MRGLVAISAALMVPCACSIGALEGFSGGAADPDASATDGATIIDATTSSDGPAGEDAADAGDSAADSTVDAGSFDCDGGTHLLCATFDQGTVSSGWTGTRLESGGTIGTSSDHRSAPLSMRTQLPEMTTDTNQYAAVYGIWSGARGVRVAFDMKVAMPMWGATTEAVVLLHVLYPGTTNESYLFRAPGETTFSIEQNPIATRYQQVKDLPYDAWVKVELEVLPTSPAGTLRLRFDGLVVYENASVAFGPPPGAAQTLVEVGLARFSPPSPAIDVLYDNVRIEQIP